MPYLVVQYLGVLKVNVWGYKGDYTNPKRFKVTYSTTTLNLFSAGLGQGRLYGRVEGFVARAGLRKP